MVDIPSVKSLSEKRQQAWTREVLLGLSEKNRSAATWQEHYRAIFNEMDQAEEDYMNQSGRLAWWSKTISRVSPAAGFVYAATDVAGTGIAEESRLKRAVIGYKNAVFPDLFSARMDGAKKSYPAFVYHFRPLTQVFAQGVLFDTAWLVIVNIILFALSFLAFIRYDPR
jgi:hypothetical protein